MTGARRKKLDTVHFLFKDPRTGTDRILCGKTLEFWTWERNHSWVFTRESASTVSCLGCLEAAEKIRAKVKAARQRGNDKAT